MNNKTSGNKNIKVFLHIAAWTILFGLNYYFIKQWDVGKDFIWMYFINTAICAMVFYTNYLLLVPRLFFPGKRLKYYLSVAFTILFFFAVSSFSGRMVIKYVPGKFSTEMRAGNEQGNYRPAPPPPEPGRNFPPPRSRQMFFLSFTFSSLFLIFFSLGLRILERQEQIEKSRKDMEKEKLNSELNMLRNQISPHFFFNTLNNIYSLIGINTEDSKKAILQLSKLMRYLLNEKEGSTTKLGNEIEFMKNYIDLMKLKISDKVKLTVDFPDKYEDINIPPLLLISFIENAFKHGVSYRSKSYIDIKLETEKDTIIFTCKNSIAGKTEDVNKNNNGIGLENVKRRLNLLFPGKHELLINKGENEFSVFLKINTA